MNDLHRSKRESLATPCPPSSRSKRAKAEHCDTKLDYCTPPPLPLSAPHGVERIPLPVSLNVNRLPSQYLSQLASERTDALHRQGRRVVGLPVLLNDGIVLNWVRHKSGSVDDTQPHKVHDNAFVCRQGATWLAEPGNERCTLPVVSGGGSGSTAADAIVIDSDEDDEIDFSDSDRQLLPSVHSGNKVENDPEASHLSPLPLARELSLAAVSDVFLSDQPPRRALTGKEHAVASSSLRSNDTDTTTTDFEVDGAQEEINDTHGMSGSRFSTRHAKSPSLPSLKPIRMLLARRELRGDPERDVLPKRTIVTPRVSKKQRRKKFLEEAPTITSSESEEEIDRPASDPQLKRVPLPKTDHGRARRLLMPESADLPLVAVTMRGDCHFIERKKKFRISGYSLPNPGVFRHVGDACMVGNTAVLGCDKGTHQISFLPVAGKPQMIDVTWSPHSSGPRYQDTQKRGVSRLAAIHAKDGHIKFLSGGYDGTIYEWTAGIEKLSEPRSRKVVSHGACIMALAYRDRDRSVIASAQRRLHITDLNRYKTVTHAFSNVIQQIHIHPQAAYVTLLEVRHLNRQIQLYDSRKGGFDGEPCLSFGHRSAGGKFLGTHTRGSVHLVHFAMASEDGGVLLWDFRNIKRAVIERRFQQAEKVVHTIFADRDITTFGQGVVTFFEDYLAR